jgi:transcriptional regulator with XRE-family HTH domain
MRPLRDGVLTRLIKKATKHNQQREFAALLGVKRSAVYKWNRGKVPDAYWQMQINALCKRLRLPTVYKTTASRLISSKMRKRPHRRVSVSLSEPAGIPEAPDPLTPPEPPPEAP